ncbi:hypothetical protein ABEB36_005348 [Hypothenemus hampei]|uniref:Uncharacterized protein n=1 Tax=Hypothenemus hampei TaxID=57062 RepID=A0ABD1F0I0_HYPHA
MISLSRFLIWCCLTLVSCMCHQLLPYQQDITFPGLVGQFHGTVGNNQQPTRQYAAGFHLNPPPPPFQFLQPFNQRLLSVLKNPINDQYLTKYFRPINRDLFTPNNRKQKPETNGQLEEYQKYLKEEADYLEKETQPNEVTTDFITNPLEVTSLEPNQKTFVRVNIAGKDYGYST